MMMIIKMMREIDIYIYIYAYIHIYKAAPRVSGPALPPPSPGRPAPPRA